MKINIKDLILRNNNSGLLISALILFFILSIFSSSFLTSYNIFTIGRTTAMYAIIGLSQAIVLVVGDMNLSVGAIGGLSTITAGYFMSVHGYNGTLSVLLALLVSLAAGFFNGIIITKFKINAFIVTLGTSFFFTGIIYGLTRGEAFLNIPKSFLFLGRNDFYGIPYMFLFIILVLIIIFIFFKYTLTGRRILLTGENIKAAEFSGININNIKLLSHILSGFMAGVAGVIYISRLGSSQPRVGQDWLIISFAVAIIGGTLLTGGSFTSFGLLLGAVIMVLIKNGLVLLKVDIYWEQSFLGILIVAAVGIDRIRQIYRKKILLN